MGAQHKGEPWPYGMTMRVSIPSSHLATLPVCWFFNELEEIRIALKCLSRYSYDNHHQVIELSGYGTEFAFSIERCECQPGSPKDRENRTRYGERWANRTSGEYVLTLNLWNARGNEQVFREEFLGSTMKPIPSLVAEHANEAMIQESKGNWRCSECGELKSAPDLAGRYFAGRYCEPCWLGSQGKHAGHGGWKAVEARETYE